MRIKIINPNTTQSMTDSIERCGRKGARPDTVVYAVSSERGPESIECYVDEYMAIPGILEQIRISERDGDVDGYVIACFCDPGLQAAREITDKPVVGIAQAAITVARTIAPYFSVVSVLDRSRKMTEDMIADNGAEKFCRSIRSTGLSVLEFDRDPKKGLAALIEEGRKAVELDKAECILLGCAGFAEFVEEMNEALGVPVLDGVAAAVKLTEAFIDMGVKTSKKSTWGYPESKTYKGYDFEI